MEHKKEEQYAIQIVQQIYAMFEEDSDNFIDLQDVNEDDNATKFIHALANMAPTMIYNRITGDNKNHLHFNHLANQLCFQFSNRDE